MSQCMDGWAISNTLIAPFASTVMLIVGTIITILGVIRVRKLFLSKKPVN